jgi:hypothetical protein
MKRMIIILALWLIVICFQTGCTITHNIPVEANLPEEFSVEKLPIAVGVYYSEKFQSLERTWERVDPAGTGWGTKFKFDLGPPSITLFDQIFSNMFEKVVPVHSLPPPSETVQNIDAVLVPKLVWISGAADTNIRRFHFEIKYTVGLYNLNGTSKCNYVMSGVGESELASSNYWTSHVMAREATNLAMRNFAARFIAGFRNDKCLQSIVLSHSN